MTNRLIPTNAEPLYRQLMARIRDDVSSGVYPAESQIPSEQEMCARYGVSRVTVRRAISELTDEGILRKQQGKGTFVCTPKLCRDLRDINSFHECCRMQGVTPGTRLIHAQLSHADERTQRELELPDDRVVEIERVRTADGVPVMLETNSFPLAYSDLLQADLSQSLYAVLEGSGITPKRGIHEISLHYATNAQARLLEVDPGQALLLLREVVFDQHGRPLHTSYQLIRGDRFTFRI